MATSHLEQLSKRELVEQLRALQSLVNGQLRSGRSSIKARAHAKRRTEKPQDTNFSGIDSDSQKAADHYANLYASVPVGCLSLDARGCIEEINLAGAAMLGWARAWLVGQPFSRWIVKDDVEIFAAHLVRARASNSRAVDELRIKNRHGRSVDVRLESAMVGGTDEASMICQTVLIDVTEGRQAERKARLLQAELAHVARLNTMGELASGLAHELNQPLGAVVLYCDTCLRMLRSGAKDQAQLVTALEQTAEAAGRAREVIRHLRGFLRKDDGQRETVELNALVRNAVRLIEAEVRDKGSVIRLELTPELPRVTVDRIHIEQVLLNLMRNAIEAMGEGGTAVRRLSLRTRQVTDNGVEVSVQDTGPGLTATGYNRAFEPFYTTKANGMGMGLAICRSIIEAHAGRLWGEPSLGEGAVFHFTLPVARLASINAKPAAPGPTVFVVDDDGEFLCALVLALKSAGLTVASFASPRDFLDAYRPERSGCLLLDVRMPEMTGLELQQVLNARGIRLPIVFITGHGDVGSSVTAFRHGAVDFLEKPFNDGVLLDRVQQALARDARTRQIEGDRALVIDRFEHLTPREQEVMTLVVSDKSAKEIAAGLKISPRTVEHHREHVMAKMEARSPHDLVIMAVICGVRKLRL